MWSVVLAIFDPFRGLVEIRVGLHNIASNHIASRHNKSASGMNCSSHYQKFIRSHRTLYDAVKFIHLLCAPTCLMAADVREMVFTFHIVNFGMTDDDLDDTWT